MLTLKTILVKGFKGLTSRIFAICLLCVVMCGAIATVTSITRAVYIVDNGVSTLTYTTKNTAEDILEEEGIVVNTFDEVKYAPTASGGYTELSIVRAYPITLTVDGNTRELMVTGDTVDQILFDQKIFLAATDIISHPIGYPLQENDHLVIQRVSTRLTEETVAIPFENVNKGTSLLRSGRTRLLQNGTSGTKLLTYSETTIDGIVHERELIAEDVIKQPIEQITLVGDGSEISILDYSDEFPLDENGVPLNYKAVYHNQIATGYSAGKGAWGASGEDCMPGTVAVRAAQFPYGTKMYIRTPDGSFLYGYAVSNDTGIGLMDNVIDVDLFYATYAESALNGRKYVDIYVLE